MERAPITSLSNDDLTERLYRIIAQENYCKARFIETLIEFDRRRLYLELGCDSLFAFCVQRLRLSSDETYFRLYAAHECERLPALLAFIAKGALTLTAVRMLGPHLTHDNHDRVLKRAAFLGKTELRELIAELHPSPPVPTSVRAIPPALDARVQADRSEAAAVPLELVPTPPSSLAVSVPRPRSEAEAPPSRKPVILPLSPEFYLLKITIQKSAHEHLREIQDLLRHRLASGDPAAIVERALHHYVEHLRRRIMAETARPRAAKVSVDPPAAAGASAKRHIPADLRRRIFRRDAKRCAFVGINGMRCSAKSRLQIHHVVPFAKGGTTTFDNLQLRCRAHNKYEAELDFGARAQQRGGDRRPA